VAFGRCGFAGFATAHQTTLGNQPRPSPTVDGGIHPASAEQRTVGRVDDRVDRLPGYVSLKNLDGTTHNLSVFKKEEYSLILQFLEPCGSKAIEPRRPLSAPAILCNGFKNFHKLNLAPNIPLVQSLAENGFINSLQ
jgi:hypothetical protein